MSAAIKPKELKELVTLATDGEPIVGYAPEELVRKKRFLALSLKCVKVLAERLGAPGGARINPAGPAVSGEAYLSTPDWEIHFEHHSDPRNSWGDVFFRRGRDRETVWVKWEALLDFDGLVGKLRKDPRLADRVPGKAAAE